MYMQNKHCPVSQGEITMGTLIAFILYLFNIVFPVIQMTYFFAELNTAAGAAERVEELLEEDIEENKGTESIPEHVNEIAFDKVSFAFTEDSPLFDELSLSFPVNQKIALVGASGAGKSTIFNLLLRFYRPQSGRVTVSGKPIDRFELKNWRSYISLIAQDSPMISGSIRENLLLGCPHAVQEQELARILDDAQLTDFVNQLPDGLDSEVGENGVKLSGGQKQRIAIARAMLQDSPLLLCDEATSNLDATTEYKIQQAMSKLTTNRTTITSAHRLSTVIDSDLIYVIREGRVLAQGTHSELLQSCSYYNELVEHQFNTDSATGTI